MKFRGRGWKNVPLIKLLAAFISGILAQFYLAPAPAVTITGSLISISTLLCFFFIPFFQRFRSNVFSGVAALALFISLGALAIHLKDVQLKRSWIGNFPAEGYVQAVVTSPPIEKPASFKLSAQAVNYFHGDTFRPVTGKIFIYLDKDVLLKDSITQGSFLIFRNRLTPIKGFGNPGGFDYGSYCRMKGISHQVFLRKKDLMHIPGTTGSFARMISKIRHGVLNILRRYIQDKKECGLAEALLIGYKNDLDKSLLRDYSDSGVVHIIAISGLHVGLIYWLLGLLLKPLERFSIPWLVPLLIISGLWLFSIIAGAQPSILRAAVMFSCLVIGAQVGGRNSTYNTIAFSAFALLCIDPFWLWDAGFQLSYAAVVSIIAFMRPIYSLFYFKNPVIDFLWQMNAVTISAQVLTIPVCMYYFKQFPVYFLLTNLVAVPLSTIILFAELILICLSVIPEAATFAGMITAFLIRLMNDFISVAARFPFATWDSLSISILQALLLLGFFLGCGFGIIDRSRAMLKMAIIGLTAFIFLRTFSFYDAFRQRMIIVYNIPGHKFVDLVNGRQTINVSDTAEFNFEEKEFYVHPSRIIFRTREISAVPAPDLVRFYNTQICFMDENNMNKKFPYTNIDLLILSGNPRISLSRLAATVHIGQIVSDATVPTWKSRYWRSDCDSLGIPYHDVTVDGAFVKRIP